MKLSEYAAAHGIQYRAAWNRYRAGKIPGAYKDEYGTIVVPDPQDDRLQYAAVYARVSSNKQRADLERQAERMAEFAQARGLQVVSVVTEVASGLNDDRPKLARLLRDHTWGTLVVEHKDRLARAGFNWMDLLLRDQGREVVVANTAQDDDGDLVEDFVSIIYSYAARLYGARGGKARAEKMVIALED